MCPVGSAFLEGPTEGASPLEDRGFLSSTLRVLSQAKYAAATKIKKARLPRPAPRPVLVAASCAAFAAAACPAAAAMSRSSLLETLGEAVAVADAEEVFVEVEVPEEVRVFNVEPELKLL